MKKRKTFIVDDRPLKDFLSILFPQKFQKFWDYKTNRSHNQLDGFQPLPLMKSWPDLIAYLEEKTLEHQQELTLFLGVAPDEFIAWIKPHLTSQGKLNFGQFLMERFGLGAENFFSAPIDLTACMFYHVDFTDLQKVTSFLRPRHMDVSSPLFFCKWKPPELCLYVNTFQTEDITFGKGCIATNELLECLHKPLNVRKRIKIEEVEFKGDMCQARLKNVSFNQCDLTGVTSWAFSDMSHAQFYNGTLLSDSSSKIVATAEVLEGLNQNQLDCLLHLQAQINTPYYEDQMPIFQALLKKVPFQAILESLVVNDGSLKPHAEVCAGINALVDQFALELSPAQISRFAHKTITFLRELALSPELNDKGLHPDEVLKGMATIMPVALPSDDLQIGPSHKV